jgi:hypothetical protein
VAAAQLEPALEADHTLLASLPLMPLQSIAKTLIVLGAVLLVVGVLVWLGARIGLGNLPGDLAWRRGNTSVYIPIVSSIVFSIVFTVVLNLLMRFFR